MRTLALALGIWLLGIAPAAAFNCAGVRMPWDIVICTDPGLQTLADERLIAYEQAETRLAPAEVAQLREDQRAWVHAYSAACGIRADRPPPIPVPASVVACFRRAGAARLAYLRTYGAATRLVPPPANPVQTAAPRAGDRIGPSFDCSKVTRPLPLLICADPGLSRRDLRFNQAYWALYQQAGPAGRAELQQDDRAFIAGISERCGLPPSGALTPEAWQARGCIENAYEQKRQEWIARLTGAAYQEAVRPPELALALQRDLARLGFVESSPIDGAYGPAVRAGISVWQRTRGLPVTGLLGDMDARILEQEPDAGQASNPGAAPGEVPRQAVAMRRAGGTYAVPVRINGAITLPFMIDSGASDVLIPADVVLTLARTGTIADSDFIGDQTYTLADGSTIKSARFMLRDLQVGGQDIHNVTASIGPVKSSPLLGQSFLSRFTSWTLDNERHALVLGRQLPVSGAN
ncbi:MAG: retroviral-like aspartic protease family protein [Stellaceae bacterium]